ncbi:MAG: ABC transporter transmembrane domain-containing protein, partial [Pseudomonadota bacterium]|nr:ABC transporter transmembrane domain-containing protein [Pseudomonadota bacterium]
MNPDDSRPEIDLPVHDPYLDALEFLANHYGLPFSRADIVRSLPLEDGRLDTVLFCRAAERIGLNTRVVARKPSDVSALACPYVVPLARGEVAVATARLDRRRTRIVLPGTPVREDLAPAELDLKAVDHVVYVAPVVRDGDAREWISRRGARGHWLWSVVAKFWATWIYVIAAAFFINLLGLALPLFVMNVYDRVVPNNSIATLWALAIGVGIALMFDFVLRMLRSVVIDSSGQRIDMRVSSALFQQAMDATMSARPANTGEIASHIREFETVRE